MKLIKTSFVICLFFFAFNINAQNNNFKGLAVNITGKVIDKETNQPLEYATIVLENTKTKKVSGGITDANGDFKISTNKGTYNITVEFIGFEAKSYSNQVVNTNLDLGTIALIVDTNSLDEVEIIAEKSTVEIRLDKRIYNVGKDMTVKGGTAADVLDNVPSVSVDVEGNVSLRGNENVRILINGKPSGLVGLSSTDALRQFPADAIARVEVITSPSARYDAEGTAGILNIILRKGKGNGFNGSVTTTAGTPELYGLSGNANYRTNKVNIFSNVGYRHRTGPGNSSVDVTYLDDFGAVDSFRDERLEYDRESDGFNVNLGTEYFINDKSSITGTLFYRNSDGKDISTNNITDYDSASIITETSRIIETEEEEDKTLEYSLNYTNNINDSGHKLTIDLQRSTSDELESALVSDFNLSPVFNEDPAVRTKTDESNVEHLIQADYVKPIKENSQFELGLRFNLDDLESDYLVEDFNQTTNQFETNTAFSNNLNFKQNIYAFYAQYGSKIADKFSFLLGLRTEVTDIDINLENTNENFDKNYTELFPTVNLGYELNDDQSFTLGYSRRLRRPRHWFLNPFRSFTSQTNYFVGNVDLDPTFTNSFDLGYLHQWDKVTLNSSVYYQRTTNNFQFVSEETGEFIDGIRVIRRRPINLSSQDRYGFELTANYNPSKKVRFSGSFNFFSFKTDGEYSYINTNNETITQNFDADNTSWTTRFNTRITLPWKIEWQTRMFYRGPQKNAQSEREGIFSTNLAFSKDLFKEKATVALNVSDLFNSRKRRSTNFTTNTLSDTEFQWRERQITLNFTYRFNQKKKRQRSQNGYENGGEEGGFQS